MRLQAICLLAFVTIAWTTVEAKKVVCFYNSKGFHREGQAQYRIPNLEQALQYCTHLVYGYAGIKDDTFEVIPLDPKLELPANSDHFRAITNLRRPGLKVILSIGGGAEAERAKYLQLLESAETRTTFANSVHTLMKAYEFDGVDLAWEFPETKPKKIHSTLGSIWKGFKKIFGSTVIDEKEEEHRDQFAALVHLLKGIFRLENRMLTVSVIPNVNSTVYYDVRKIINEVDQVHLLAYDYYTPERNPKEADYPAPLHELIDRNPDANVNAAVRYWLNHGAPSDKIILGIPTFARTFKMTSDSAVSGVPPLTIDGPGEPGAYTKEAGLLSYPEVCTKIRAYQQTAKGIDRLRKIGDPTKRYGTYAFRLPDKDGEHGMWVGYEDPDTVKEKTLYAKRNGLGGVALCDLTLDDFKGLCDGTKYPLLLTAKQNL